MITMSKLQALLACLALCSTIGPPLVHSCPGGCTCVVQKQGQKRGRREVICRQSRLTSPISPDIIPLDTVKLDLSYNDITDLRSNSFQGLTALQKLDLNNNQIRHIEARAFDGLDAIEELDLSSNQLGSVNNIMFTGLETLRKLNLSSNQISTISVATFDRLQSLEKVDFSSEYLICDCYLKWIVNWRKSRGVRISENTVCAYPRALKGQRVKSLKRKDFHCDWPLELPLFEINPDNSQVVFTGDTIFIECKATYLDDSQSIIWLKNGQTLNNQDNGITIVTDILEAEAVIKSTLTVPLNVDSIAERALEFECRVITSRGNLRKTVTIIVMDNDTPHCKISITQDNKGQFNWPKTIAGLFVKIPCPQGPGSMFNSYPGAQAEAERQCDVDGNWLRPDTLQCQYADPITQTLETFSVMDFTNVSIAVDIAQQLADMTTNGTAIRDPMNVVFIGKLFDTFSKYWNRELGKILINIAGNLMDVVPNVLRQSQVMDRSCSKIIITLEKFADNILHEEDESFKHATPNIAMEVFQVTADSFNGRSCALFVSDEELITDDQYFKCFPGNISTPHVNNNSMSIEASIRLPRNILGNLNVPPPCGCRIPIYKLQFFVYKNGNLFPTITNTSWTADDGGRRTVASNVISSKIANYSVTNLTKPAILTFKPIPGGKDTVAAYWDFNAERGKGAWRTDGCELVQDTGNFAQAQCNHLTNFAILKEPYVKTIDDNVKEDNLNASVNSSGSPLIRLYQHSNFHGAYQDYTGDALYLLGFNDEASSIRVYGGIWVLYEDDNFRGRQYHVVPDEYNDANAWSGFNDNISSLKLLKLLCP